LQRDAKNNEKCRSGSLTYALTAATWLLYAILVVLTDNIAKALNQPFAAISIEMVCRSLYFFTQAHQRGQSDGIVAYLTAKANLFGIVKRQRKTKQFHVLTKPALP